MKFSHVLILLIALVPMSTAHVHAQEGQNAAQTAENLRGQLRDVEAEDAELEVRLQQLDWDLRPENIERYFAAVGSTRPEELREQRRRQLQNDKQRASNRRAQLATSRARLQTAIGAADAKAYIESAQGASAPECGQMLGANSLPSTFLPLGVVILVAVVSTLTLIAIIRRHRAQGFTKGETK